MSIITAAQLWENYDRFGEVDAKYLKVNPFDYRVYFNGERVLDSAVRVYARLTLPQNKVNPPVIILLNNASESADSLAPQPFLNLGYAVLSVDYGGIDDNAHCTRYPRAILNEIKKENNGEQTSPKQSCWYHWTACVLHAITFLEQCEHVDGKNIGIVGISEGASLVFKTAFLTKLKAGMTFFCADNTNTDSLEYLACLDSRAYSKNNFPILINASSNEKNGGIDYLNEMYTKLNECYFSILPRANGCVGQFQRDNIKLWFDHHFFSNLEGLTRPQMNMFISEDNLYCEINAKCVDAKLYAASNDAPYLRNWNEISLTKLADQKYLGKIEVFTPKTVLAFAVITLENGLTLSTQVLSHAPPKLAELKKSRLIYNPDMGADVFIRENGGIFDDKRLEIKEGSLGLNGVFGNEITTFKLGERRFSAEIGSLLQIILFANTSQEVEFKVLTLDQTQTQEFCCFKRVQENDWTTITLSQDDFKSVQGRPQFENAVSLTVKGENIIVNSILWI